MVHLSPDKMRELLAPRIPELPPYAAWHSLNDRQRAFVDAMVRSGGHNLTACALEAGYPSALANQTGYRLAHLPKVRTAIKEAAAALLDTSSLTATKALIDVAGSPGDKDRMRAAIAILDRTGFNPTTKVVVTSEPAETKLDKMRKIVELAKALGQDPRTLLGAAADVSAEDMAMVLGPAPVALPLAPVEGRSGIEGLEDLLGGV
jgi:phage terminase small subunit